MADRFDLPDRARALRIAAEDAEREVGLANPADAEIVSHTIFHDICVVVASRMRTGAVRPGVKAARAPAPSRRR